MSERFDLVIIGGGPGGYPAALEAAALGKKAALVEAGKLGGTCLNRGCIPTKTLLHAAECACEAEKFNDLFTEPHSLHIDSRRLCAYRDTVTASLRDGIAGQLKNSGVKVFSGRADVADNGHVRVYGAGGEESLLEADNILIAAGSAPSRPHVPGLELPGVLDSDGVLTLDSMDFKSAVIVGGGVIGVEFATFLNAVGCAVTIIEGMPRILPGLDREISQSLKMLLSRRGVDIFAGASLESVAPGSGGQTLTCSFTAAGQQRRAEAQTVIVATGRRACADMLFDDRMTEKPRTERGHIIVDEHYRTDVPHIYAVGDITNASSLAHAASSAGKYAVHHMFGQALAAASECRAERCGSHDPGAAAGIPWQRAPVPSCIYTSPEIAVVGMTQEEAKASGIKAVSGKYLMSANGKSVLSRQERGFVRLVAEQEGGRLIGAQLMCARATDIIGELCLAIAKGVTVRELAGIMLPHPTFCEGVAEAALLTARQVV